MDIPRERQLKEEGNLMSLAVLSLTLPQIAPELDALCLFTGMGEDERAIQPIKRYWEATDSKNRILLVPGYNEKEKTWREFSMETLSRPPFDLKRTKDVHVEIHMGTTKDQAEWTVKKIQELSITSCGIVSTPFHLLRSYATTLAAMLRSGIKIPIFPVAIFIPPEKTVPEAGVPAWDLFQGEAERILKYQEKGDVISHEDFKKYIDWLWQEPILKKHI